jgi:hypothetical protein
MISMQQKRAADIFGSQQQHATKKTKRSLQSQFERALFRARKHGGGQLGRVSFREAGRGDRCGDAPGATGGGFAGGLVGDRVTGAIACGFRARGTKTRDQAAAYEENIDQKARHGRN